MLNRIDTSTVTHSHLNRFPQVIERIGLAIMGVLCGLFVAALVAKADIEAINSIGVLFSAVLYGSIGFYLGTNIPSLPAGASGRSLQGVSDCADERRRHIPHRLCSTRVGIYDHTRRGAARHLECRDRFLVVSRRAAAARRWQRRASWTIHRRLWRTESTATYV